MTKITIILTLLLGVASAFNIQAQDRSPRPDRGQAKSQRYSIEQACSDKAQLHTIAFSGLAFITGDFGADTFLPPGKVCDFFGFQYMRDIDAAQKGHNPVFLNRVAGNVLKTLTDQQRKVFEAAARKEAGQLNDLAKRRWPLIKAFRRQLTTKSPSVSQGLNKDAVIGYVGDLFATDAEISYARAQLFALTAASLNADQKAFLAKMKFGDFNTWPEVDMDEYKLPRGTEKMVNVVYMTYASEFFSWYAGSIEADTYFCPERHGTYFGGFYMKDMPAMGKRDYDISTSLTGDSGQSFLELLTAEQRKLITAIPNLQRKALKEVVEVRRAIATELRKPLSGGVTDKAKVLALGRRYGELDGEMSWYYATAFAKVNQTLTDEQRAALMKLRNLDGYTSAPAYIYSAPVREAVELPDTDFFFKAPTR
ncbi:MAG: Spy/CpxP family protein refolding chaperone [Verrucomicrobiota bacterium]|nr:Spy/CpxP family protein refolding chaperone [Verrucomicrobiota bacterium]